MRKTDHRNQQRQSGRRVTALLLASLMAAPAFGDQKPEKAMLWETFVRQKPGMPVVLVLHDGERVEGRLLGADLASAEVLDTRGLGLSDDEQERLTRDLLKARRAAARQVEGPAHSAPAVASAGVRRLPRDEVAAVYVPRRESALWGAMKVVAFTAATLVVAAAMIFVVGGTPT